MNALPTLRLPQHTEDLASLERKQQVVRDFVTAVVKGYKNGLYLHGSGGVGKSFTVLKQLNDLNACYKLYNSRMTGKGLFLALAKAPDAIHVLEDMERITKDADAQGVLRSALWTQPGHDRVITWTTATDGEQRFEFRGRLVLISNRPLSDLPELRALATRIEVHRLEVTSAELESLMIEIAGHGFQQDSMQKIDPEKCLEVTEHLLAECRAAACPLDLRLQQKSFQTFLQWEAKWATCHWKDLVAASVREATCHFRYEVETLSVQDQRSNRLETLRGIIAQTDNAKEQEQQYIEKTGGSRADFYRRKREISNGQQSAS